jgi:predicted regulator of Ras-like GTPase activity (Roadblock/LC7/MglB family)
MRLSESFTKLIESGAKFVNEADQEEAQYIAALRSAVLKKAKEENFSPDLDHLESVMFEAYDRDIPLEDAKERVWIAVYVDRSAGPEEIE